MALKPEIPFITKENINSERDLIEIFDVSDETIKLTTISSIGGGGGLNLKDGAEVTNTPEIVVDSANSDTALRLSSIDVTNYGNGGITTNTAFGEGALVNATIGNQVAIGLNALKNHNYTYEGANVAIGVGAGENFQAEQTVMIGLDAAKNYTGYYSVAIGSEAMANAALGGSDVAIGSWALRNVNGGFENVVIGAFAADNCDNIAFSVIVGEGSVGGGSTTSCIAIGQDTMRSNVNTSYDIAIGIAALRSITTGDGNVGLGHRSGYYTNTGNNNTFIGRETGPGYGNGTVTGSIALGAYAVPTGNNQFVVGSTGVNAGTVTNAAATQTHYWTIKINGTDYKVLLGS